MLKGTTKTGFKFELDEDRLENYELVEALAELEENPVALPKVLKMALGAEQTNQLKEHIRSDKGFVPAKAMEDEMQDIFLQVPALKNF